MVVSVAGGLAVQRGYGLLLVAAGLAGLAVVAAGRWRRGLLIGLLVLSALNGLPFLDVTDVSAGVVPGATDLFVPVLVVALAVWNLEQGAPDRSPRLRRLAWTWSVAFVTWWALVWGWSVVQGISPIAAAVYGRDFLWFGLLLPLTIGALRGRDDVVALSVTLGAGAMVYSVAQNLAQFAGVSPSDFIHADLVGEGGGGYKRYFAAMGHLEAMSVALGAGLALVGRDRSARIAGGTLLAVVGTAVALQFTRAFYASFALAFVLVTGLWAIRNGPVARRLRRATAVGAAALTATVATLVLTGAGIDRESPPGLVAERTVSGVTQVQQGSGTFGQRQAIYESMLRVLGPRWPVGLGFVPPDRHYVAGLPEGSVRNSDVGLLNALMTMGVIGLGLLFAPVVGGVVLTVRSASMTLRDHWLVFGASLFLLTTLVSSPTLITLFSVPGLVLTATLCAATARVLEPSDEALSVAPHPPQPRQLARPLERRAS